MNSRLCGCSFIRPGETIVQGLARAQRMGFTHVDIGVGGGNGHFRPEFVAESPDRFAEFVYRETQSLDMQPNECFLLNFGWPINTPDAALRERTRELFPGICRFAKAIGCKSVLLIPGPVHADCGAQRSLSRSSQALNELVAIASDYRLQVNVEADIDSCANAPEIAEELCRQVPGLGLTLDYSHFICQGIAPSRIERLHPHSRHVHIRQAARGQIATDPDQGEIDFPLLLRQLKSIGYSGLFCIEYLALSAAEDAGIQAERRTIEARHHLEHLLKEAFHEN